MNKSKQDNIMNFELPEWKIDFQDWKPDFPEFKLEFPEFKIELPEWKIEIPERFMNAEEFVLFMPELDEFKMFYP